MVGTEALPEVVAAMAAAATAAEREVAARVEALEAPKVAAKVRSLSARCLAAAAASIGGRHSVCRALRAASRAHRSR